MFGRVWPLVRKEFHELRRDRYARIRLFVPPILQMLIFGYAATFDVAPVSTALLDRDHSQESRALVARFVDSGRFRIVETARDEGDITDALENGKAVVGLVIHAGFAQGLRDPRGASMQVVVWTVPTRTPP